MKMSLSMNNWLPTVGIFEITKFQVHISVLFSTMTTIQNLPEETLFLIFGHLEPSDLQECQKACKAFYFTAHFRFLREIVLLNDTAFNQFITSIDSNPNRCYLAAVKYLDMSADSSCQTLSKENIEKLFMRSANSTT
jgi:hypothetical protein